MEKQKRYRLIIHVDGREALYDLVRGKRLDPSFKGLINATDLEVIDKRKPTNEETEDKE